jgi:hypothetical protein
MPLKPCRECKKEVSTEAKTCPHCGASKPTRGPFGTTSTGTGCVAIIIAAVVIGMCVSSLSTPTSSGPSASVTTPPSDASAPTSNWNERATRSEMDGSAGFQTQTIADGPIQTWLRRTTPRLIIRCDENKTDVFVLTETAAQPELGLYDRARVRLRFDQGTPQPQTWTESTDDKALFAPSPIALARRIAKAKTLRFEFTPFNAPPAIATFSLDGGESGIKGVARACGWAL